MNTPQNAPIYTAAAKQMSHNAQAVVEKAAEEPRIHVMKLPQPDGTIPMVAFIQLDGNPLDVNQSDSKCIAVFTSPADFPLPADSSFKPTRTLRLPESVREVLELSGLRVRGIFVGMELTLTAIQAVLCGQESPADKRDVPLPEHCRWLESPGEFQQLWPPERAAVMHSLTTVHNLIDAHLLPLLVGPEGAGKRFLLKCYALDNGFDLIELDLRTVFARRIIHTGEEVLLAVLVKLEQALAECPHDTGLVVVEAQLLLNQPQPFTTAVLERLRRFDRCVLTATQLSQESESHLASLVPLRIDNWSHRVMGEFVALHAPEFVWTPEALSVFSRIVKATPEANDRFSPWRVESILQLVQQTLDLSRKEIPCELRPDDVMNVLEILDPTITAQ